MTGLLQLVADQAAAPSAYPPKRRLKRYGLNPGRLCLREWTTPTRLLGYKAHG